MELESQSSGKRLAEEIVPFKVMILKITDNDN